MISAVFSLEARCPTGRGSSQPARNQTMTYGIRTVAGVTSVRVVTHTARLYCPSRPSLSLLGWPKDDDCTNLDSLLQSLFECGDL